MNKLISLMIRVNNNSSKMLGNRKLARETLLYSGLSNVALKFPGEKSFPSLISVVSFTCCHFPDQWTMKRVRTEREIWAPLLLRKLKILFAMQAIKETI